MEGEDAMDSSVGPWETMRAVPTAYASGLLAIWSGVALTMALLYDHHPGVAIGVQAGFQGVAYVALHRICKRRARAKTI